MVGHVQLSGTAGIWPRLLCLSNGSLSELSRSLVTWGKAVTDNTCAVDEAMVYRCTHSVVEFFKSGHCRLEMVMKRKERRAEVAGDFPALHSSLPNDGRSTKALYGA